MTVKSRDQLQDAHETQSSALTQADLLKILVNSITDYAIITLDTGGTITSWSPTAERLTGYQASEVIGKNVSMFYTPEDIAAGKLAREFEITIRDGRFDDEGWRVRKDGTKFWASVALTALRDEKGNLRGFGRVTRDLSARKLADERIRQQTKEIMEMATVPVVQIWEGILLVPLIGMLDSERTQQLMERLLQRITDTRSPVALVDITGVPMIDTQTAQHLIETIQAVRYVGADVVLTGVRPAIAQTLVHLGVDLSHVITRSSLRAGLTVALRKLNLHIVSNQPGT